MSKFTALEKAALQHLAAESDANGHDFGLMELALKYSGIEKASHGGIIASLAKKGVIIVHGKDQGYTQYEFTDKAFAASLLKLTNLAAPEKAARAEAAPGKYARTPAQKAARKARREARKAAALAAK